MNEIVIVLVICQFSSVALSEVIDKFKRMLESGENLSAKEIMRYKRKVKTGTVLKTILQIGSILYAVLTLILCGIQLYIGE